MSLHSCAQLLRGCHRAWCRVLWSSEFHASAPLPESTGPTGVLLRCWLGVATCVFAPIGRVGRRGDFIGVRGAPTMLVSACWRRVAFESTACAVNMPPMPDALPAMFCA